MWISRRRRISAGFFPGATLDMNFAQSRYLGATPSQFAASLRGSDGYADDSAGVWSVFSSNVPRITNKGLLVEEARTNSIRNNSMQGAVAGVVGSGGALPTNWGTNAIGLTTTVVGTGTENGVDYVDIRYNGTTTSQFGTLFFDTVTGVSAGVGESWSTATFIKLVSGSFSGISDTGTTFYYYTAASAFISVSALTRSFTSTLTRYTQTATTPATTGFVRSAFYFNGSAPSGVAVDFTIRIGWPQLELGAFATSPIRTTAGAVTRAADAVSLTGANFTSWYTGTSHTLFGDAFGYTPPASSAVGAAIASIDDTTGNERIQIRRGDGSGTPFSTGILVDGGAVQANIASAGGVTMQPGKIAFTYAANDANQATNGTLLTQDTSVTLPTVTQMQIGNGPGASCWNGYIRRIAYFPSRLANAELQAITT